VELVEDADTPWAKHPYHAADGLPSSEARSLVRRSIEGARSAASRELRAAVKRARERGHGVSGCAILVGAPMPDWSVDQVLAVHFRMHQAEGALFRDALVRATEACGLRLVEIPEKSLAERAEAALATPWSSLQKRIAQLGKSVGPPWGKDEKDAALAAMVALQGASFRD
jgi:hypothetical protein